MVERWQNPSPDRKKNKTIHRRKRNKRKEKIMISNVYQSINYIFMNQKTTTKIYDYERSTVDAGISGE